MRLKRITPRVGYTPDMIVAAKLSLLHPSLTTQTVREYLKGARQLHTCS